MFDFLKKNKVETVQKEEEDSFPATITFKVDDKGSIFIDGIWDVEAHATAPFMFAELLAKVSNGDMFLDTLIFLKEFCIENDAEELYEKLLVFIKKVQDSNKETKSSELVVKPTDFSKQTMIENMKSNENDLFGG